MVDLNSTQILSNTKSLFSSLPKFAKVLSFLKAQVSFPSNFASIFSAMKDNSSVIFYLKHYILWAKKSSIKCKFLSFSSVQVKILMSILKRQVNSFLNFPSFSVFMTHTYSVNFKLIDSLLWIKR